MASFISFADGTLLRTPNSIFPKLGYYCYKLALCPKRKIIAAYVLLIFGFNGFSLFFANLFALQIIFFHTVLHCVGDCYPTGYYFLKISSNSSLSNFQSLYPLAIFLLRYSLSPIIAIAFSLKSDALHFSACSIRKFARHLRSS